LRIDSARYHIGVLLLGACAGTAGGAGTVGGGDVVSIRVEPESAALATSDGNPVTQAFTAVATFGDGDTGELDLVSWDLSNASIGSIDSRGRFVSVDENGGEGTITATFLDNVATAELSIVHSAEYLEEGVDETAAAAMAKVDAGSAGLSIVYPRDLTRVPRNLEGLRIVWTGGEGSNIARLRFASRLETVDVYTTNLSEWTVPTSVWQSVSATNRKGSLSVQVLTGTWDGAAITDARQSDPITVEVNRFDATGSVLFWSTADQAVMRIVAGGGEATRFYPETKTGECYGCHEIAESRQWMVVTRDGVNGTYQVIDVSEPDKPTVLYDIADSKRLTFHALSPDGQHILGVREGALELYDLGTNTWIAKVTPDGYRYTHVGWAPDGTRTVAVRATGAFYSDMTFSGGEIVTMTWDGSRLGTPTVLVANQPGVNFYYPAWSPDGDWIVFNRSTGDSYGDPDAEIWLIDANGGTPVRLDNANGEGPSQNSLSRWAPLPDDDILWLAFSSKQRIGLGEQHLAQIWVAAIDPVLMREGKDPSSAPYWLPGQNTQSDSHVPVWWSQ
jgi:hypothetical protein